MFKKMLVLALLLPGLGGCIWSEGRHGAVIVSPIHAHCIGCHHVYRGGVWVSGG
jgi:hypothetical protein